jgi:predicted Zn-ribbon and HTH transcriptional regulator
MAIITNLKGYECDRCGHRWVPRSKLDELPTICPKCKSPYWNKPRQFVKTDSPKKSKIKKDIVK